MSSKLREALDEILNNAKNIHRHPYSFNTVLRCSWDIMEKIAKIKSEPLRNCDVGTAEEQETMFTEFCDTHKYVGDEGAPVCSRDCPCYKGLDCGIRWSQMPYEEVSDV